MATRDFQRSKAYEAENALRHVLDRAGQTTSRKYDFFGSLLTLPEERKFGGVENVQTYVDKVLTLNWVRATWDRARFPVRVRERRGDSAAHYYDSVISVPVMSTWALREIVVLHEIAHHLSPGDRHGSDFCGTLVALVSEIIGAEAGLILRWSMDQAGVAADNKVLCTS